MPVTFLETAVTEADSRTASEIVFTTLPDLGFDRMTPGKVEFVLCASALTAQV